MDKFFSLHLKNGTRIVSESEAIAEALRQEKAGIKPRYKRGADGCPGWLVWSTFEDGVGVAYRRSDGKMMLATGWQGDFTFF